MIDLYKVLEVTKKASKEKIRDSYIKKSKQLHPDVGGNKEEFQLVCKAYKVLIDPENRKRYDSGEDYESILNPKNDKSLEIISQIFINVLNECDPIHDNIIRLIEDYINNTLGKINEELKKQNSLKEKFEICVKRVKHKDKKNLLVEISKSKIKEIELSIKKVEEQKEFFNQALKRLEDFDYSVDLNQFVSTDYISTGTSTSF